MKHILYSCLIASAALIVIPTTASAAPWYWHHATPIYPVYQSRPSFYRPAQHHHYYRPARTTRIEKYREIQSPSYHGRASRTIRIYY